MKDRIEDVVRRFWPNDTQGYCSVDEAADKFRKALKKSRGQTNTELSMRLAVLNNTTDDDLIRLGSWRKEGKVPSYEKVVRNDQQPRKTDWGRRREQQEKKFAKLQDTIFARILQQKGLWEFAKGFNIHYTAMTNLNGEGARYWEDERKEFSMLMCFAFNDTERIVKYAPKYVNKWSRMVNVSKPTNVVGTEWKLKKQMLEWELAVINELPQEVLERVQASQHDPYSVASCYFGSTVPRTDYYRELSKMFLESMEYMGLGMYCDWMESDHVSSLPSFRSKGLVPLFKKVLSVVKTFNTMVKKGFAPDMVRDEVMTILNDYARVNCKVHWVFTKRVNAPVEYPELVPAKKKAANHSSNKAVKKSKASPTIDLGDGLVMRLQ